MTRIAARAAALLAATAIWGWVGNAAAEIATVAKSDDLAPGAGGAVFDFIGQTSVNGRGQVVFPGFLKGSGVSTPNGSGLWAGAPGGLALVSRGGDPAPGVAGAVFGGIPSSSVSNGAGVLAFVAGLTGSGMPAGSNQGLWVGPPGDLALVVRTGQAAPGAGGAVFGNGFGPPFLNGAGDVAFQGPLTGGGVNPGVNDLGIWAGPPGAVVLAARLGDLAPGAGGAVFKSVSIIPSLNGAGELAFDADLTGGGTTPGVNDQGIWAGVPGGLVLAARRGSAAPGTGGAVFDRLVSPLLNGAGELAFLASLMGSGTTPSVNDAGVWAGAPGGLVLVARRGNPAPGAGGAVFDDFSTPVINGAGELAFFAFLRGSGVVSGVNDRGLWIGPPGGLALVTRTGQPAPGAGGAVFESYSRSSPVLNGAGEVAFSGILRGSGVSSANDTGLWAGAPGRLHLVVREGGTIEVAPSDVRTVTFAGFFLNSGNEDGQASSLNEDGQTGFFAGFVDGSTGAFLSSPDTPTVHRIPYRAVDGAWDQVMLPRSFAKPVIIAGPPDSANKQPGVVRLREIDGAKGRFEARFNEWRYLDGKHPEERADFLALEQGRHKQSDGSIWVAGTVKLKGNRKWKKTRFTKRFRRPPQVFATVQSSKGGTAVAARVRNVTKKGFEVSIQEEEKDLRGKHPKETVGYLAVFSRKGKGAIAGGVEGTDYRLKQAKVGDRFKKVLGQRLGLEEEKSKDKERKHAKETVSVMTLGRGLYAQQASDKEVDTTAVRRR